MPETVMIQGIAASPAAGAQTYGAMCVSCHGVDGTGHGGTLAADFTSAAVLAKSDDTLLTTIRDGVPGTNMPAWGIPLGESARRDVLAYIRASFGPRS